MTSRARKWLIVSSIAAVLLIVLSAIFSDDESEVDKLKAQLRAKGEKISFSELGLTNSRRADWLSKFNDLEKDLHSSVIQPDDFILMRMDTPQTTGVSWKTEFLPVPSSTNQNSTQTWTNLSDELEAFKDEFTFLHSLLENPPAEMGHDYRNLVNWPKFPFIAERRAVHWLTAATLHDLHFGQRAAALKKLHTLISMTHFLRNDLPLVVQMFRVFIGGAALNVTWQALQADGWDDLELSKLQSAWAVVSFPDMLEKGLLGERAVVDAVFQLARTDHIAFQKVLGGAPRPIPQKLLANTSLSVWQMLSSHKDEMLSFSMAQKGIEHSRQLGSRPWPILQKELNNSQDEFEGHLGAFGKWQHWLSSMIIPSVVSAHRGTLRNETGRQLVLTAIALKRYQLRHGKFPSQLNSLIPGFLPSLPIDPMICEPLHYDLHSDGTFTLYSVGEDGKDGGGNAPPYFDRGKYVAKLWLEGDDIVWPKPGIAEEVTRKEVETTDGHR